MKLLEHENNNDRWQAKEGDASAGQIVHFAADYQTVDEKAWAVCVTEGVDWIAADHVRQTGRAMRANGAIAVWVSDGGDAQCVWRKPEGKRAVISLTESKATPTHVDVNIAFEPNYGELENTSVLRAVTLFIETLEEEEIIVEKGEVANG